MFVFFRVYLVYLWMFCFYILVKNGFKNFLAINVYNDYRDGDDRVVFFILLLRCLMDFKIVILKVK